jgi:hypothetical protein
MAPDFVPTRIANIARIYEKPKNNCGRESQLENLRGSCFCSLISGEHEKTQAFLTED